MTEKKFTIATSDLTILKANLHDRKIGYGYRQERSTNLFSRVDDAYRVFLFVYSCFCLFVVVVLVVLSGMGKVSGPKP